MARWWPLVVWESSESVQDVNSFFGAKPGAREAALVTSVGLGPPVRTVRPIIGTRAPGGGIMIAEPRVAEVGTAW